MVMTTTNTKNEYVGNNILTDYPWTFRFLDIADVKVYVGGVLQVKDTDYTVVFTSEQEGGTVTFLVAPGAGVAILIQRVTPKTQPNNYNNGPFPAESVENSEDRIVAMVQETEAGSVPSYDLPAPEADKVIGWNATADALENKVLPDVTQAEADAAAALSAANAADAKADTALSRADAAVLTSQTADAKADQAISDAADADSKASSALSLATNNAIDIAAIDTSSYTTLAQYNPEQAAQDAIIGANKVRSESNETALVPLNSRVEALENAEIAINGSQTIGNGVTANVGDFLVDSDSETSWLIFFEIKRRTDTEAQTSNGIMYLNWDGDSWEVERGTTFGNYEGVEFDMTQILPTEGQLTYTSNTLAGANYTGEFSYQAWKFPTGATFAGTNAAERFTFIQKLKVGNIRSVIRSKVAFHIDSDEGGFVMPVFTTAARDALWVPPLDNADKGVMIYNSTLDRIQFHIGTSWLSLEAGTPPSSIAAMYIQYPDDATYVINEGPAIDGSVYYNTTDDAVRVYANGAWYYDIPITAWGNSLKFLLGQIVYDGILVYRCTTPHTSIAAGTIQDDIANWAFFGVHEINNLTDVDTTSITAGDVLAYDGASFVRSAKNQLETELILKELAATPSTPGAGYVKVYPKTDKRLYILDSTGRETLVEVPMDIVDLFDDNFELGSDIKGSAGVHLEVVASLAADMRRVNMQDTTGLLLGWYVGAAASEVLTWVSGPGTDSTVDVEVPAGSRISVRALLAANGQSGELSANFLG